MNSRYAAVKTLGLEEAISGPSADSTQLEQIVTEVFESLREPIYRYLYRLTGSRSDAEDLAQEAFLRLYRSLYEGKKLDNVRAWVFQVAHNLAIDRQRKRNLVDFCDEPAWGHIHEHEIDPSPNAEQQVLLSERRRRMTRILRHLSPQERHCLDLRTEGLCYREIAEVLAIRPVTVVTFLRRAIQKIVREPHE